MRTLDAGAGRMRIAGRMRLRLSLLVMFAHVTPHSASYSVLPELLLPLVDGKSDELAQLIGTLSLMTSLVSLVAVPLLTAASDTRLGRKNVLLLGLALDVVGELCLATEAVRSSRFLLLCLAPIRAISASVMPMCHAAAAQMEPETGNAAAVTLAATPASKAAAAELAVGERFGSIAASINAALILGPLLGSYMLQTYGPSAPFHFGACLTAAAWVTVLLLWPAEPPPARVVRIGTSPNRNRGGGGGGGYDGGKRRGACVSTHATPTPNPNPMDGSERALVLPGPVSGLPAVCERSATR